MSTFMCFFTGADRRPQRLKHRWERLPKHIDLSGGLRKWLHGVLWDLRIYMNLNESRYFCHGLWDSYSLWWWSYPTNRGSHTQWEELKFLAGINHNCTMYISISYEHHEWYVIACKELHCPGSNIFICFLTKLVVVWVKWVWLQQLGWLWGRFFFEITLPTARP